MARFDQSCFNPDSVTASKKFGVDTLRVDASGLSIDVHQVLEDHQVVLEGGGEGLVLPCV